MNPQDARARLLAEITKEVAYTDRAAPRWRDGRRDCLMWTANIVRRAIGMDPAAPWRGKYCSRRGALRVMGKGGLLAGARRRARKLGLNKIKPEDGQPGDWGIIRTTYGHCSVLYFRDGYYVGVLDGGTSMIPANFVLHAWSIV